MRKKHFIQFLRRYIQGRATYEERKFIESYYDLFETDSGGKTWRDQEQKKHLKQNILKEVWIKIRQQEPERGKVRKIFDRPVMTRIAAAVIILVATGITLYLADHRHDNKMLLAEDMEQRYKNDIEPGGNKAVLILSNGQKIILDHMAAGTFIRQGNVTIQRQDSGELVYKAPEGPHRNDEMYYNTITTPPGGEYKIILPDGTKVWLNAGSSLRYPVAFNEKERNVSLSGEAYFEVAKQVERPFTVNAGSATIQVLGTDFDINAYNDEKTVRTTLSEGTVKVLQGNESRLLKPGEQASMDIRGGGSIAVAPVNMDEVLAWKDGLFYFENTNIQTIMAEVGRWYDVQVIYTARELDDKNFSGVMSRYNDVSALLKRLELTGTVHFKVEGRKITVMD